MGDFFIFAPMNFILFDDPSIRTRLRPLSFTRPISEMRVGILTIKEKWEKYAAASISCLTEDYLSAKYPVSVALDNLMINAAVCPDPNLWEAIGDLVIGEGLYRHGWLLAARVGDSVDSYPFNDDDLQKRDYDQEFTFIDRTWHIFLENGDEIKRDIELLTRDRKSARIDDPHTIVYNSEEIFVEDGVKVRAAILNAEKGPIYLGKNVEIQEGSIIQGPASFGEGSVVSMGAKIRDNTTVGPYCKVGGEVKNSVIIGYSNKPHEGFLGNSVIGEWCNIGADANSSNLKNNYANVKVWDYETEHFMDSGLQFNGMVMGDHSKIGINSMINTGTVIGVGTNIFGSGFPRNFIPSFSWGGSGRIH